MTSATTRREAPFAHPVERELARVFDEHGIDWEYEPRRKARKVPERAGVTVEILFRRDIEQLARRWSLDGLARAARSEAA
jgi:hypothetical protein